MSFLSLVFAPEHFLFGLDLLLEEGFLVCKLRLKLLQGADLIIGDVSCHPAVFAWTSLHLRLASICQLLELFLIILEVESVAVVSNLATLNRGANLVHTVGFG